MTTWKPVDDCHGRYEVSNDGAVRSLIPHNGLPTPRPLKPFLNSSGYPCVVLRSAQGRQIRRVHHLVLAAFVGPRPPGMETRHMDGDPTNNRLSNLAYGTHSENLRDKARHGTDHQATKTHCPQGHPYDEANTYRPKRGGRMCRACRRTTQERRTA